MIALLLSACAADPADTAYEEPFLEPDVAGDWLAGTEAYDLTGSSGVELTVQVWFPASEADEDLYEYDGLITYGAADDGVPDCSRPRPVVMFSHGNSGIRYQSMFLTEWLAARGYLVVAPDHTYNTYFDMDYGRVEELVFRRPVDIADSFSWLVDASNDPDHALAGCVDEDAGYAMVGHSFGGYTTMAVSSQGIDVAASAAFCDDNYGWLCDAPGWWAENGDGGDFADIGDGDRVWASVPLAPAGYEVLVGALGEVGQPSLVLGGGLDTITPMDSSVRPIYSDLQQTPRYLGELVNADHYTFSDICHLLPTWDGCEEPAIPIEQSHDLINVVVTAHLDAARGFEEALDWLPLDDPEFTWESSE
jgi:predicted dienelactone hydrolase